MRYEIVKVLLMDNVGVFMKKSLKVLLLVGLAQSAQGFERAQGSRGFGSVVRNVAGATFGGAALATAPLVVHHACKNSQNFMPLMDGLTDNPLLVPTLAVGGGVGLGAGLYASRNDIKNAYNTIKQNTNFNVISSNWFSLASSFSLGYTAATFAGPFLLPEAWVKPAALGVAGVCLVKGLHGASTNEELSRRVGAAEAKLGQDQKFRTTLKEILETQNNEHGTLICGATTMRDTKVRFQQENVQLQDSLTAKTKQFDILNNEYAVLNEQHTQFKVGIGAFCRQLGQTLKVQGEASSDDTYRATLLSATQQTVTQRDDLQVQNDSQRRDIEDGKKLFQGQKKALEDNTKKLEEQVKATEDLKVLLAEVKPLQLEGLQHQYETAITANAIASFHLQEQVSHGNQQAIKLNQKALDLQLDSVTKLMALKSYRLAITDGTGSERLAIKAPSDDSTILPRASGLSKKPLSKSCISLFRSLNQLERLSPDGKK